MKRIVLSFVSTFCSFLFINAATIKWDGEAGDGLWITAGNWVGNTVPATGDDVVLDNTIVGGNYYVEFPGLAYNIVLNSFAITPAANNTITFKIPNSNIADQAFDVTGAGDAITLNNGAIFINASGRTKAMGGTAVTVGTTNFVRINNGARYVHNTASGHTNNLVSRLSTVAGTEKGIFEFDTPDGITVSLTGRTYGTLILSSVANGGTVTYSGNGVNPLTINGNFIINAGVTFSIGLSAAVVVKGNYQQSASSTFNLQNASNSNIVKLLGDVVIGGNITSSISGHPVLEFGGSVNQNISVSGSITNNVTAQVNNVSGITLSTPVILPYKLNLQNGKIRTSDPNFLIIADNATISGASTNSFIEGPMRKTGDDNFTFPIGKGEIYTPVGFTATGMSTTDIVQAEYKRTNPQTISTNYEASFINHISYVENWDLNKVTGTGTLSSITLPVTEYSFAKVFNTISIAEYDIITNQWKNNNVASSSQGTNVPPYVTGTLTSTNPNQFGKFTLATSDPTVINPLPIHLISFKGERQDDDNAKFVWQIAGELSPGILFILERSGKRGEFIPVSSVKAGLSQSYYSVLDINPGVEKCNYRLKMVSNDGIFYSSIISLDGREKNSQILLWPNPVTNSSAKINSPVAGQGKLCVYDIKGRIVKVWTQVLISGTNNLFMQPQMLKPGIYFMEINTGKEKSVIRFVKQ